MILLDTNALLWFHAGHRRSLPLARVAGRLYASPASLLEVELLVESGRLRLRSSGSAAELLQDDRWLIYDPPAIAWFERALEHGWSRDPFDRLLVAHAQLRGWRLATADRAILARMGGTGSLAL